MANSIRIGTGVLLKKENSILLFKYAADKMWRMPGGKLEADETLFECIQRETFEETGIEIHSAKIVLVSDPIEGFVTIGYASEDFSGKPEIKENEKFSDMKWFDINDLPKNIFEPSRLLFENWKKGVSL